MTTHYGIFCQLLSLRWSPKGKVFKIGGLDFHSIGILRIPRVKRWPVSSCRAALWRISSLDTCGRKIRARCRWIWVSPRRDRVTSQGKICKAPFFAHFFIEFCRFDIIIKCQNKINEIFTAPCYLDDSFSPKMTIWNEYGRNSSWSYSLYFNRYNMYIYIWARNGVLHTL